MCKLVPLWMCGGLCSASLIEVRGKLGLGFGGLTNSGAPIRRSWPATAVDAASDHMHNLACAKLFKNAMSARWLPEALVAQSQ
jgi:hypothetical protein